MPRSQALTQPDIQEIYDGKSHGIKITLTGNAGDGEILYGESEKITARSQKALYTRNTGSYTEYYTVTKKNFDTHKAASATVCDHPGTAHCDGRIKKRDL